MQKPRLESSGGLSVNRVMVPIIVAFAILHIAIVILIVSINSASLSLSRTMQDSGVYIEDATSVLAGSSLLSETCTNFVLMPLNGSGEVNVNPLVAYANELNTERRGGQVLEKFGGYTVSQAALDDLTLAAGCISDCFGATGENRCFRFGGDEFAAVVTSASPELMDRMGIRFLEEQRNRGLSIAWGYAISDAPSETSFRKLSEQADRHMYDRKKEMHWNESPENQTQS